MKVLLAIIGMPGAGKTAAARIFHEKGYPVIRFGDQTEIGLAQKNLIQSEENEKAFRENLRKELGMAAYAIKTEPIISEASKKHDVVILDGLRSFAEYEYLKKKFPYLKTVCIFANPKIRHERLYKRQTRNLTPEEAIKRDLAEVTNLDMARPIALTDYLVENEDTLSTLQMKLEKLMSMLK